MEIEERIEKSVQNIYEWLGREFSYQETGAPNAKIMLNALNELTLDLEADGKYELSHYLCVQSPFYSGIFEFAKNFSAEELREGRRTEEAKFPNQERDDKKWAVAKAYCLEEEYEHAHNLHSKNERSKALELLIELAKYNHYYANLQLANEYISQYKYLAAVTILKKLLKRRANPIAYITLGGLYLQGNGVNQDRDKSLYVL